MTFVAVAALLCLLLFAGVPVAFALGLAGVAGLVLTGQSLLVVAEGIYSAVDNFVFLALPLFILMSHLLLRAGLSEDIFAAMHAFFRHWPGGLAVAAVASCAFFAAISGSSTATAATIGIVAVPAMIQRGYEPRFVACVIAAGGTLGILIPPSVPFILYGAIAEESVGKLFIAGVIPGLVMAALIAGWAMIASHRARMATEPAASWGERWAAVRRAVWALLLPPAVMGGLYTGVVTPTEAAAAGVVLSLVIGAVVYRRLTPSVIRETLREATHTSAMLLAVVAGAKLFGHVVSTMQISEIFSRWVAEQGIGRWGFLIAVNLVLILLGDFLDPATILRGAAPFMVVITVGLVIMMLFPSLSLWLPGYVR